MTEDKGNGTEIERLQRDLAATKQRSRVMGKLYAEKVRGLEADLEEAVELTHRLLAPRFPSLPYLKEKKGNLFLVGRALLKKHGRLEEGGE